MQKEYSTQLISVSAVGIWSLLSQAPEALKLLSLTIAVAAGHALVAWLQLQKQKWDKARERLDRQTLPPAGVENGSVSRENGEASKPEKDSGGNSGG